MSLFGHHFVGSRFPRPKTDLSRFPRTGSKRLVVLRVIAKAGKRGVTDEEMGMQLVLTPAQIGKYRLELIEGGFVQDANKKRKTSFGDETVVWRLTAVGQQQWDKSGIK